MPVTINGNGHISGLVVGGLPDGSVDADTLATHAVTTNNGSNWYARSADGTNAIANGSTVYTHNRAAYIFDVTDTSTHKVKFTKQSAQIATVNGDASSDNNLYTYVIFKKLGDT